MCCNADVLFSVMMLHWVTSKDSAGNTSDHSGPSKHGKGEGFVNKLSILSRKKLTGSGKEEGKSWERPVGITTTEIQGGRDNSIDENERDRDSKGGISVTKDHSVVVRHGDGSLASPRTISIIEKKGERCIGAVGIAGDLREGARGRGTSTEDLVRKTDDNVGF